LENSEAGRLNKWVEGLMLRASLEIKSGNLAGQSVLLKTDQIIRVGRLPRSDIVVADDNFLSSVHFTLEFNGLLCRLRDGGSANGTHLNGTRVTEAVLRDGDEITAGHTTFVVRIVETQGSRSSDSTPMTPPPALGKLAADAENPLFNIGSWSFGAVPSGWETIEQHGIRRVGQNVFPSNAVVSEEPLPAGKTLQEYVDLQTQILQSLVPELKAEAPIPANVAGAEEALDVQIRHTTEDGRLVLQRQLYAKAKQFVGVLTLTTLQSELPAVQSAFESILSHAIFSPQ
jgi:pSer/pThr/pTyr-binding forkhead associated (FHA) protein